MSGERIVAGTNALIRMFAGVRAVVNILVGTDIHVSFITEIEHLATSKLTVAQAGNIRAFLGQCRIIGAVREMRDYTIEFRKHFGLKLPDCLIAATAAYLNMPLVTGDKAFDRLEKEIALYRI